MKSDYILAIFLTVFAVLIVNLLLISTQAVFCHQFVFRYSFLLKDQKITFSSSNPNIISVDQSGNIFGVSSGEATITATAENGVKGSITLNVYSKVEEIKLDIENLTGVFHYEIKFKKIVRCYSRNTAVPFTIAG